MCCGEAAKHQPLTYSGDAGSEGGFAVIDVANGADVHMGLRALVGAQQSTNCTPKQHITNKQNNRRWKCQSGLVA
jgi:hypothetical protein